MKFYNTLMALPFAMLACFSHAQSITDKYDNESPIATDVQKKIFSKLFDVELWSKTYPKSYNQDITIRIVFASQFDKSDAVEFISEEAQEIHNFSDSQLKLLSSSLSKAIDCSISANTTLDFNYIPKQGVFTFCNDNVSPNVIPDGPHAYYFLDVFLHSKSEYTNLIK
ncbi:hypothetical protein [Alteromonas stellipolaris]|uniref:hypothetical protein n=1 Tax=Alteromonas stellipolaris TaxID=233316 RepID=UPI0024952FD0|nr:hypothetical protein [Alteromonas stellipolaris]